MDLRKVMDKGQVLIMNLSKGRIGEDASALLGSLLVSAMQTAAMSRSDVPESDRRDFYLYVDEFQNFATDSFATILSEARKYRLNLTTANQYLAQMEQPTADAVFGNVGTLVAFQVGAQDAERVAEQLGPELTPQDLLRLPRYHAYARLLINGMPSRPFSMSTLPPRVNRTDPARPDIIRRYSRQRYARPLAHIEAEVRQAFLSA
ncbi:MAG: TraM recognition domain-containing protein [Planctomycetes bacterium]|nr:TraM recognition domain-containing protein [Planctomycetota bacterium]